MKLKTKINEFKEKHQKGVDTAKKLAVVAGSMLVGGIAGWFIGTKTGFEVGTGTDAATDAVDVAHEIVENLAE